MYKLWPPWVIKRQNISNDANNNYNCRNFLKQKFPSLLFFYEKKNSTDIGMNLTYIYTYFLFCILLHLFLNFVINEFSIFSLRFCSSESSGWGGCDAMCCGRGYRSFTKKIVERCECKYYWCCYVKCKTCEKTLHLNVCR